MTQAHVLVVCHDGKKLSFKLKKIYMVKIARFNLVSVDQMKNEQIIKVVLLEQFQRIHGKARKYGPSQTTLVGYW
jgi:hypothetical protein